MTIDECKEHIQLFLNKQDYTGLDELFNSDSALEIIGKDHDLYVMSILSEVHRLETANGVSNGFLYGRSMKEAIELYQELVFYLRRIEFDLPKELQMEIVPFISENNISGIGIWAVVQGTKYLYAKDKIIKQFDKLLEY